MPSRSDSSRCPHRPVAIAVGCLFLVVMAGGCVTSPGRAYYTAHMSARIEAGPASNTDIAAAFGLDDFAQPSSALAAVEPE